MHDDRTLVEGRLERALQQFIRPAQYGARTPSPSRCGTHRVNRFRWRRR